MIRSIGIRELRDLSGQLSEKAAAGDSFFLTKNGTALYYAIPVGQALMEQGSRLAIALNLFKNSALTINQAAKLAEQSVEEFMVSAGKANIAIID